MQLRIQWTAKLFEIIVWDMPKVVIQRQSQLEPKDAFCRVRDMLSTDKDLHKLDPGYECVFDEEKLSGSAKGKLFNALMEVKSSTGICDVEIIVDLPLHLALAKGMVQKTLQKKLEQALS